MRRRLFYPQRAILCLALAACSAAEPVTATANVTPQGVVDRDYLASFQTDSLTYQLRAGSNGYEVDIGVTFTNHSPATAYFENCGGATQLHLEQQFPDSGWVSVWSPILPACLTQPIVVQPQASASSIVTVFAGYPGCNCSPQFMAETPGGVYRLVWTAVYGSYNSSTLAYASALPFGMRASNAFNLVAQPR